MKSSSDLLGYPHDELEHPMTTPIFLVNLTIMN